ncbi:MAG: metallophosphoesterase family protein [Candidatus Helarchaeota archaeon]|nr:metallophosphoesterase family protein [Candidatus Helarchaeota archaeon]
MRKKQQNKIGLIIIFIFCSFLITSRILISYPKNTSFLFWFPKSNGHPFQIHATWSLENASESITITWRTETSTDAVLKYDITSRNGNFSQYLMEKVADVQSFKGYINSANISNLLPNTTYYFICGSEDGGWSSELKFKTPSLFPKEVNFVAGGDSRTGVEIRNEISNLMAQYNPEFVLHTGDIVDKGDIQGLWDVWFNGMQKYWKTNENYTIPIIPSLGNHERNADNYYKQFALPNNEQWYSIDYSSLIHIISLNSETNIDGAQLTWLQNDLENHKTVPWKFVIFHQPPYSSGYHGSRMDIRNLWSPIFDQYNVTIVFNGHDHNYERSKPIRNNSVANSYENGTMYVVSGGWGAPLRNVLSNWWTNKSESEYHFCLINISTNGNNSTLTMNEIRLNGTIGDTVSINKIW